MATAIRWFVVVLLFLHGLIHLLGTAKALRLTPVEQLQEPIPPALGLVWAAAAVTVLTAAVMIALRSPSGSWIVAGTAAVLCCRRR